MDAIKLLDEQHDEVEALFDELEAARTPDEHARLFEQIGDALAVHAAIEEKIFYPAVHGSEATEEVLLEAVEEHLAAKRVIADLIDLDPSDEHFRAKLLVLRDEILHHVKVERKQLFPKARRMLDHDQLDALGEAMDVLAEELKEGLAPRLRVQAETAQAAELR